MFCEVCFADTETCTVDGHEACSMCGQVTRGGPSVHTSTFSRKSARPEKIHKSVSSTLVARGVPDSISPAMARVAQASVAAAFAGGRAPAGAARALANRAIDDTSFTRTGDAIERAEAIIGAREASALGKAGKAQKLLERARAAGTCKATPQTTEGAWALAAIVAATCEPPIDGNYEAAARDAAHRCDVPMKSACVAAISSIWASTLRDGV